jgi:hypothetical protein
MSKIDPLPLIALLVIFSLFIAIGLIAGIAEALNLI